MGIATAKSSGNIGDVWSALPALKEYCSKTDNKVILYLVNGQSAIYYEGAVHPTKNEEGVQVMLNLDMIKMMIPLLKEQYYIEDARVWNEEEVDIDLGLIRETYVNMPMGSLSRWYFLVYPDLACDLSRQYIFVPDATKDLAVDKIIINRTQRYLNDNISYSFLKEYENDLIFAGTSFEHQIFCTQFDLEMPRLKVSNFLELAQAIKQSRFGIGNQSQFMQICEGLKTPRIVELCNYAPNVNVVGEYAFDFYHQVALEYYVATLSGKDFGLNLM